MERTMHNPDEMEFEVPGSIEEAEDRILQLKLDLARIRASLIAGAPKREGRRARFHSSKEFVKWERSAKNSEQYKIAEMTWLRHWMKRERRRIKALEVDIPDPRDPVAHIAVARRVLRGVAKCKPAEFEDMKPEIRRVAGVLETYLEHTPQKKGA